MVTPHQVQVVENNPDPLEDGYVLLLETDNDVLLWKQELNQWLTALAETYPEVERLNWRKG